MTDAMKERLQQSKTVRRLDSDKDEQMLIKSIPLITAKQIIYMANI